MNTVKLRRDGKVTEISAKWRDRFLKDGWSEKGKVEPEEGYAGIPKVTDSKIQHAVIHNLKDKGELEEWAKKNLGIDLDKRKSLDNMKADAHKAVKDEG